MYIYIYAYIHVYLPRHIYIYIHTYIYTCTYGYDMEWYTHNHTQVFETSMEAVVFFDTRGRQLLSATDIKVAN